MKVKCNKCKREKDKTEFYKDSRHKAGHRGSCIACDKKYDKAKQRRPFNPIINTRGKENFDLIRA